MTHSSSEKSTVTMMMTQLQKDADCLRRQFWAMKTTELPEEEEEVSESSSALMRQKVTTTAVGSHQDIRPSCSTKNMDSSSSSTKLPEGNDFHFRHPDDRKDLHPHDDHGLVQEWGPSSVHHPLDIRHALLSQLHSLMQRLGDGMLFVKGGGTQPQPKQHSILLQNKNQHEEGRNVINESTQKQQQKMSTRTKHLQREKRELFKTVQLAHSILELLTITQFFEHEVEIPRKKRRKSSRKIQLAQHDEEMKEEKEEEKKRLGGTVAHDYELKKNYTGNCSEQNSHHICEGEGKCSSSSSSDISMSSDSENENEVLKCVRWRRYIPKGKPSNTTTEHHQSTAVLLSSKQKEWRKKEIEPEQGEDGGKDKTLTPRDDDQGTTKADEDGEKDEREKQQLLEVDFIAHILDTQYHWQDEKKHILSQQSSPIAGNKDGHIDEEDKDKKSQNAPQKKLFNKKDKIDGYDVKNRQGEEEEEEEEQNENGEQNGVFANILGDGNDTSASVRYSVEQAAPFYLEEIELVGKLFEKLDVRRKEEEEKERNYILTARQQQHEEGIRNTNNHPSSNNKQKIMAASSQNIPERAGGVKHSNPAASTGVLLHKGSSSFSSSVNPPVGSHHMKNTKPSMLGFELPPFTHTVVDTQAIHWIEGYVVRCCHIDFVNTTEMCFNNHHHEHLTATSSQQQFFLKSSGHPLLKCIYAFFLHYFPLFNESWQHVFSQPGFSVPIPGVTSIYENLSEVSKFKLKLFDHDYWALIQQLVEKFLKVSFAERGLPIWVSPTEKTTFSSSSLQMKSSFSATAASKKVLPAARSADHLASTAMTHDSKNNISHHTSLYSNNNIDHATARGKKSFSASSFFPTKNGTNTKTSETSGQNNRKKGDTHNNDMSSTSSSVAFDFNVLFYQKLPRLLDETMQRLFLFFFIFHSEAAQEMDGKFLRHCCSKKPPTPRTNAVASPCPTAPKQEAGQHDDGIKFPPTTDENENGVPSTHYISPSVSFATPAVFLTASSLSPPAVTTIAPKNKGEQEVNVEKKQKKHTTTDDRGHLPFHHSLSPTFSSTSFDADDLQFHDHHPRRSPKDVLRETCPVAYHLFMSAVALLTETFGNTAIRCQLSYDKRSTSAGGGNGLLSLPNQQQFIDLKLHQMKEIFNLIETAASYVSRSAQFSVSSSSWNHHLSSSSLEKYRKGNKRGNDLVGSIVDIHAVAVGADVVFPMLLSAVVEAAPEHFASVLHWIQLLKLNYTEVHQHGSSYAASMRLRADEEKKRNYFFDGIGALTAGYVMGLSGLNEYMLVTWAAVHEAVVSLG